jgi:hypothetical protein
MLKERDIGSVCVTEDDDGVETISQGIPHNLIQRLLEGTTKICMRPASTANISALELKKFHCNNFLIIL